MDLFFFDIETCGAYKDYETFKLNDERGALLFEYKFSKMKKTWEVDNIDDAYLQRAGVITTYGKIVCISFGFDDNGTKRVSSYYGDNEEEIVTKFNDLLRKIEKKPFTICGFRITNFDLPWLLHKLHKYNIDPAYIIYPYDKKPWEGRILDLNDVWKQKFAWTYSFDELCYELGIVSPKDDMNGSQVHEYYYDGRIEDIKTYCEKDVASSIDVSLKLKL